MSDLQERTSANRQPIKFIGQECRGCGDYHEPVLPFKQELVNTTNRISIRCPDCGKTNPFERKVNHE